MAGRPTAPHRPIPLQLLAWPHGLRAPSPYRLPSFSNGVRARGASVLTIRVAGFALDDQCPSRDWYLADSHSVFVDGYLIPVEFLVNNRSIAPAEISDRDVIESFHIGLENHEVIFAEGVVADTCWDGRENFANFVEYEKLYGNAPRPPVKPVGS
jgi:hypothetical protein